MKQRSPVDLVCLDFDGTIVEYEEDRAFIAPAMIGALNALPDHGLSWCANSGRTMESQLEVLELSQSLGLRTWPTALICSESVLFVGNGDGYLPVRDWNDKVQATLPSFHHQLRSRFADELASFEERYPLAETLFHSEATAYLLCTSDEVIIQSFFDEFRQMVEQVPHGVPNRNGAWVFAAHDAFGKGKVLQAYLDHSGRSAASVLAVGDNLNDVDMLDGSAAAHVGCPANAISEVQDVVASVGGMIAPSHAAAGTLEILRHHLGPTFDSP